MSAKNETLARCILLIQQVFSGEITVPEKALAHHKPDLKVFADEADAAGAPLFAYSMGLTPPGSKIALLADAYVSLDFGDEVEANDATLWAFSEEDERTAFCHATGAIPWLA